MVGISISWFKTYWKRVFNLIDIKTTPTFKEFLQAKPLKSKRENSYYQQYDVKILIALHKQAVIEQHIYKNILSRRSVVDYSPEIIFEESLIHVSDAKSLTKINQPVKHMRKKWFQ